jgi:hypothetical protein
LLTLLTSDRHEDVDYGVAAVEAAVTDRATAASLVEGLIAVSEALMVVLEFEAKVGPGSALARVGQLVAAARD